MPPTQDFEFRGTDSTSERGGALHSKTHVQTRRKRLCVHVTQGTAKRTRIGACGVPLLSAKPSGAILVLDAKGKELGRTALPVTNPTSLTVDAQRFTVQLIGGAPGSYTWRVAYGIGECADEPVPSYHPFTGRRTCPLTAEEAAAYGTITARMGQAQAGEFLNNGRM